MIILQQIFALYLIGIFVSLLISIILMNFKWKFTEAQYIFFYPAIPFIIFFNFYQSKQYLINNHAKFQ